MENLLDRIVQNMNTTLMFNSEDKFLKQVFTLDRKFWNWKDSLTSTWEYTSYQILLIHHTEGILIRERFNLEGKELEDIGTWRELEEKVLYTLANYAVFATTNLVEQTKKLKEDYEQRYKK